MILIKENHECNGCTACYNMCPQSAIMMAEDEEGFGYPNIDVGLCIECGLCEKVCNLQLYKSSNPRYPRAFGVKNKDDNIRKLSTSGGVFTILGQSTIEVGGCVYGASFDDSFNVVHIRITCINDLCKLRGTKYVQSHIGEIYQEVLKDLTEERAVLFTGTPCQCDGLRKFLTLKRCNLDNLLLCDIVCHGVPSPRVWRDYLKKITMRNQLKRYNFRDKKYGWHGANVTAVFQDGKIKSNTVLLRSFSKLYFNNYISRPSCAKCKYTNFERCADITIGDFWGIEKTKPSFDDQKGVSLVLINTEKGEKYFDKIKIYMDYFESDLKGCEQEQLKHPQAPALNRDKFWEEYNVKSFDYIIKRYGGCNIYGVIKRCAYNLIKRIKKLKF